jgi:NAD(P)-dependent dehydrogenase (short-subunit alcohol dehydrogenase family)
MSGRNVYNMNKFGIEGLTKGMGVELAKIILELIQLPYIC